MPKIANHEVNITAADALGWNDLHDYIVELDDYDFTIDTSNVRVYAYSNQGYSVVELWNDDHMIGTESAPVTGIKTVQENGRDMITVDVDALDEWFARIGWRVREWQWIYHGIAEVRMEGVE